MKVSNIITEQYLSRRRFSPVLTELFTFGPGEAAPEHGHEFFEIGITLTGSAVHTAENEEALLSPGSVFFVPMTALHRLNSITEWTIRNIYILPSLFAARLLEKNNHSHSRLRFFLMRLCGDSSSVLNFQLSGAAFHTIQTLSECLDSYPYENSASAEEYRENCIINILLILAEEFQIKYGKDFLPRDPRLIKINCYVQQHLEQSLNLIINGLSEELNLNPRYINRIIKTGIGIPVSRYINQCKIEKSIQLLRSGTGVTETACMLGYYDHSHFNKIFSKYTGMSPADYMKDIHY